MDLGSSGVYLYEICSSVPQTSSLSKYTAIVSQMIHFSLCVVWFTSLCTFSHWLSNSGHWQFNIFNLTIVFLLFNSSRVAFWWGKCINIGWLQLYLLLYNFTDKNHTKLYYLYHIINDRICNVQYYKGSIASMQSWTKYFWPKICVVFKILPYQLKF